MTAEFISPMLAEWPAPGIREGQDAVVQSARHDDAEYGPQACPFRRRNRTLDWAELGVEIERAKAECQPGIQDRNHSGRCDQEDSVHR